jgi:hypothetical protein
MRALHAEMPRRYNGAIAGEFSATQLSGGGDPAMAKRSNYFIFSLALVAFGGTGGEAHAQLVRIARGPGIAVNAPGAAVRVGPAGIPGAGYAVRRPLAAYGVAPVYGVPGVIVARRQARLDAAASAAAEEAAAARREGAATNGRSATASRLSTAGELAGMADGVLLDTLAGLMAQFDEDLARFTTAASWRGYLRLPDDALPAPVDGHVDLGFASIVETLRRFDSVAAEPRFRQISSVPSFGAARLALAEVVNRFDGAVPAAQETAAAPWRSFNSAPPTRDAASQGESLPTPPPLLAAPENAGSTERSVLKQ